MSSNRNEDSPMLLGTPTPLLEDRYTEISTSRRFRTLFYLLSSDKSDGDDDRSSSGRWRSFKERLGFPLLGCCASATSRRESSSHHDNPIAAAERNEEEDEVVLVEFNPVSAGGMSLAEALSAEREFRLAENSPERVSLMRLLEAAERVERERENEEEEEEGEEEKEVGNDSRVCCVCMVRKKGAAIIPCGHTFCRVCSKEVWVNRGSCPLCNRLILDVLNIF